MGSAFSDGRASTANPRHIMVAYAELSKRVDEVGELALMFEERLSCICGASPSITSTLGSNIKGQEPTKSNLTCELEAVHQRLANHASSLRSLLERIEV
jgi:hypothetical protein